MTPAQGASRQARLLGAANAALGTTLLVRPRSVASAASTGGSPPGTAVVRLLGLRYVAQGAAQMALPTSEVLMLSAAVDGLHAASMLALAALRAEYRRPALVSAAAATASAAVTWLEAQRLRQPLP
jgi:hypothetical protein